MGTTPTARRSAQRPWPLGVEGVGTDPQNFHPDIGAAGMALTSASSSMSSGTSASFFEEKDYLGVGSGLLAPRKGEDRFRSLTDLKWGEFETMGFGGLEPDEKKLQFDLTEGARTVSLTHFF
jgi:hypothetical protein